MNLGWCNNHASSQQKALIRESLCAAELAPGLAPLATNTRARALYERLGFIKDASEGAHLSMRWRP